MASWQAFYDRILAEPENQQLVHDYVNTSMASDTVYQIPSGPLSRDQNEHVGIVATTNPGSIKSVHINGIEQVELVSDWCWFSCAYLKILGKTRVIIADGRLLLKTDAENVAVRYKCDAGNGKTYTVYFANPCDLQV